MTKPYISALFLCLIFLASFSNGRGQAVENPSIQSQEVSEKDGIPVLIKHLPNWEDKQKSAVLVNNSDDLRKALGERPVFDSIEFIQGTEAVTAPYEEGKLLIIEYNTPQAATFFDNKIKEKLGTSDETIYYRRIGNYNVLLFDGKDEAKAAALFDQIKYQKIVQWLGNDHTLFQKQERAFIVGTSSLFISTVLLIVSILGIALLFGLVIGIVYFYRREKRFAAMDQFSDAGGMTRLNLDGFTPDVIPTKLLDR
jgi:hypothetical protein